MIKTFSVLRWPHTKMNYKTITKKDFCHFTLADVCKGEQFSRRIWQYIFSMSEKYYYCNDRYENPNIFMEDLDYLITVNTEINPHMNFFFLADELIRFIYKQNPRYD